MWLIQGASEYLCILQRKPEISVSYFHVATQLVNIRTELWIVLLGSQVKLVLRDLVWTETCTYWLTDWLTD
jgi:hypothetical protein